MRQEKITRYKATVSKGYLGDFATEYWTDEDHAKWQFEVAQMKADGTFGQEYEATIDMVHNPLYDKVSANRTSLESVTFTLLDFSTLN